jgi:hypothetical protein
MQLSSNHGFAFLCMPKCASSSIEAAITPFCNINFSGPGGIKHINAQDFRDYILAFHNKARPRTTIESFCVMREPIDWLFSWYRYRQRRDLTNPNHEFHDNYTGNISFDEFVESYLTEGKRPPYANVSTQGAFLKLKDGSVGVDVVYSMDRLDLVARYLSEKLATSIELPVRNKAPEMAMELSSKNRSRLESKLAEDIEIYQQVRDAGRARFQGASS